MRYLKAILLLTIILTIKPTVFSQTISNDSIKCFTYSQVRKITKDLKRGQICDSITKNQNLQIINFKEIVTNQKNEISLKTSKIILQENEIKKVNLKLKVSQKLTKFGLPSALIGGVFLGLFLK